MQAMSVKVSEPKATKRVACSGEVPIREVPTLADLLPELWDQIARFLDIGSLCAIDAVSRAFRSLPESSQWKVHVCRVYAFQCTRLPRGPRR